MKRWVRRSLMLALVGAAVLALIGPMSSAVGFFSNGLSLDVQIDSPATLVSRGAAINVPLDVVCTSVRADVEVAVNQRAGSQIAQGFGGKEITCTGDIQRVVMTVFANGKAFKKGTAIADAEIFGCLRRCGSESAEAVISIANASKKG